MQALIKKKTYQICIFPSLNFPYFQMERKNSMLRPISIVWMTEFLNYDNAQSYIISFWWIYIYMYTVYKTLTRKIKMQNTGFMIIYKSEVIMILCHSTRPHIISKDEWQHQHGHGHYSGMVSVCSYGYNWRYHWDCKLMNANTSDVILFSFLPSFKKKLCSITQYSIAC